jgi:hypothetical protein
LLIGSIIIIKGVQKIVIPTVAGTSVTASEADSCILRNDIPEFIELQTHIKLWCP